MKLLGEYAFVRSGYTFRSSLKYAREGDTSIIQMADASELVLTSTENLARANLSKIASRYLLKGGDLVMRSRGLNNSAMLISNPPERLICIAPLLYLRVIDRKLLLPRYLHWFINLIEVQNALRRHTLIANGVIRYIFARDVANLLIPIPTIQRQQDIVAYYAQEWESYAKVEEVNKARLLRVERWLLHELQR